MNGEAFATKRKWPLCAHVTIRWEEAGSFAANRWSGEQTRVFKALGRWLQSKGVPVAFLWVREVGRHKGCHTHLMVHLPHRLWGEAKALLCRVGGFDPAGEGVLITGGDYGMKVPPMRAGVLRYLCKGMDHRDFCYDGRDTMNIMDLLGIEHRGTPLPVPIKRVGCSKTISAKARSRARWTELRSMPELHAALHPPKKPAATPGGLGQPPTSASQVQSPTLAVARPRITAATKQQRKHRQRRRRRSASLSISSLK